MAVDFLKTLQSAERLFRQGKADIAMGRLQQLMDGAPDDLQALNRVGDLLARHGRKSEAIGCYRKIASRYTTGGHALKAIAIHKKILRLDECFVESLVELGRLYIQRKLPADAARCLHQAAESLIGREQFDAARDVLRELVALEPDKAHHRARLAEALAAAGSAEPAGEELLALGDALLRSGQAEQAEQSYRRAAEMLPGRPEPLLGMARALRENGERQRAIDLLRADPDRLQDPAISGELALQYETARRHDETLELLRQPGAAEIQDEVFEQIFRLHLKRGNIEEAWARFDPLFEEWGRSLRADRMTGLLETLTQLEEHGHIPALERLSAHLRAADDRAGAAAVLEALAAAHRAAGNAPAADEALGRLGELGVQRAPTQPARSRPAPAPEADRPADADPVARTAGVDEAEAPAVPLNRGDREFVAGRLTQAEILEKYGLMDQAIQQVREAAERFPGHVEAQERRVRLLRETQDDKGLQRALVALAVATRAAGELSAAREAVSEAFRVGPLDDATRELLGGLKLLEPERTEAVASAPQAVPAAFVAHEPVEDLPPAPAEPAPPAERVVPPTPAAVAADAEIDDDLVIELDVDEEFSEAAEPEQAAAPSPHQPAADELRTITAALESELPAEAAAAAPPRPDPGGEESLEEVFAAFREQVDKEVGSDDFRTHYDLGIGYKEMGLVDEAITEFERSCPSDEVGREARVMLAVCHRELGQIDQAVRWYREALDLGAGEPGSLLELRYDLADALIESGDSDGAQALLREVLAADPTFRDAQERLSHLEAGQSV